MALRNLAASREAAIGESRATAVEPGPATVVVPDRGHMRFQRVRKAGGALRARVLTLPVATMAVANLRRRVIMDLRHTIPRSGNESQKSVAGVPVRNVGRLDSRSMSQRNLWLVCLNRTEIASDVGSVKPQAPSLQSDTRSVGNFSLPSRNVIRLFPSYGNWPGCVSIDWEDGRTPLVTSRRSEHPRAQLTNIR